MTPSFPLESLQRSVVAKRIVVIELKPLYHEQ